MTDNVEQVDFGTVARRATEADVDDIVAMGLDFATSIDAGIPPNETHMEATAKQMIAAENSCLLVCGDGVADAMLGGIIYPSFMNNHYIQAQELFWWVDPNARTGNYARALMEGFEQWAREMGAHSVTMIAVEPLRTKAVAALYRRQGFRPLEQGYIKEIRRWG